MKDELKLTPYVVTIEAEGLYYKHYIENNEDLEVLVAILIKVERDAKAHLKRYEQFKDSLKKEIIDNEKS